MASGRLDQPGLSTTGTWERYRLIADNSRDVVLLSDLEGRFVWVQPSIERLLGWEPDEVVGHLGREFLHPDDLDRMFAGRADIYEHERQIEDLVLRYRRKDGGWQECAVHGQPRIDPVSGEMLGGVFVLRDDAAQISALRALATLSRAGAVLVRSGDEESLLRDTCQTVALSGQYALCWYVRPATAGLRVVATSGTLDAFVADVDDGTGTVPADGAGGRAIATLAPVTVPDVAADPAYADWIEALRRHGLRSALGLPVMVGGGVDGALVVFAAGAREFETSREMLEDLAATLGYGLGRLRDSQDRDDLLAITEAERARLRATLDSLFDPLALLEVVRDEHGRAVDLRYAEANDAAIAYNRTTRAEMIGRTMLDLFPNLDIDGPLAHYLRCAETGEPVVLDDYAFANQMVGEERYYDLRAAQTPDGIALTWRDVTDRWRSAQRLADDERRYRLVAEHGSDILWELDHEGRLVWASASTTRILGWDRDELVGVQTMDLIHPDDVESAREARGRMMQGDAAQGECRMRCADDSFRWLATQSDNLGAGGGRIVALRDIHDERLGRARLDHIAAHDPTTGAPTRAVLLTRLQERLRTDPTITALLCADVDGLSAVNESLSYAAGDQVLAEIADRVAGVVGDWDLVGRGSGDELLVMLPDLADGAAADAVADAVRAAVRAPIDLDGHTLHMTVSIGIATSTPGRPQDPEQMLRDAGIAMTQAKEFGGDRAAYVDPELSEQAARRLHLEGEVRAGLAHGQFEAWLQPIVALADGALDGYEALARWVRDDGTVVPPFDFLPLAERTGLIVELDRAVLDRALGSIGFLPAGTTVAVNLAAMTLRRPELPEMVLQALARHDVDPRRLHLEVTETALLEDVSAVRAHMNALAEVGVRWYVDDFGTGYSSISHLRDLPIAGLKLDRSFTSGVAEGDRRCTDLSQALVGLARGLGLDGVAEGVETAEVAAILAAHGWRHGQGWLYGKAAPPPTS